MTERQEIVNCRKRITFTFYHFSTLNYGCHSSCIRVFGPFKIYYLKTFPEHKIQFYWWQCKQQQTHPNEPVLYAIGVWSVSTKHWTLKHQVQLIEYSSINWKPNRVFVLKCELYKKRPKEKLFCHCYNTFLVSQNDKLLHWKRRKNESTLPANMNVLRTNEWSKWKQ